MSALPFKAETDRQVVAAVWLSTATGEITPKLSALRQRQSSSYLSWVLRVRSLGGAWLGPGVASLVGLHVVTDADGGGGWQGFSLPPSLPSHPRSFPWRPQGSHVVSVAAQGLPGQVNSRDNLASELPCTTKPWKSRDITRSSTDIRVWPKSQKSPHASKQTGRRRPPLGEKSGKA